MRPWHSLASPASPHHPWVGRPSRQWIRCSRWRRSSQLSRPSMWNLYRQKMCSFPPFLWEDQNDVRWTMCSIFCHLKWKTASEMQEILQISQTATGCSRMPLTGLNAQFCKCRLKCSKAICTWIGLGLDRLEISEASLLRPPAWLLRSQHADSFKSWQN